MFARAVKYQMPDLTGFLREMERSDKIDTFERIYAPLAILASIVFAAIASFGAGEPTRFCWALSAILSISAPFGILCAFGAPYRNVSRKLLTEGAAIASARQAERLRGVKQAMLRDGDLFPTGSITIDEVRNFGSYSAEKLLAYASAVTAGQGLEIGRVLSEALREQYGRPVRATNVTNYESGGLSADIGSDSVLVGTAAFLSKLGIRLRDNQGIENGVYVVINSQIAGEIKLTYHPTAQTYGAIHSLCRLKIRPMIAAQDFNISPAMVEAMFEVKHGVTGAVDPARIPELNDTRYVAKDRVCALLSKDGAMPYAMVQQAADKLVGAMRFQPAHRHDCRHLRHAFDVLSDVQGRSRSGRTQKCDPVSHLVVCAGAAHQPDHPPQLLKNSRRIGGNAAKICGISFSFAFLGRIHKIVFALFGYIVYNYEHKRDVIWQSAQDALRSYKQESV